MKLVVIGGESLDVLQHWVVELFSDVRQGSQGKPEFKVEGPVWRAGKLYRLEAVKDVHILCYVIQTWICPWRIISQYLCLLLSIKKSNLRLGIELQLITISYEFNEVNLRNFNFYFDLKLEFKNKIQNYNFALSLSHVMSTFHFPP
ncbi:hypothetical protein ERO13_D09G013866v2 [Gossypium hirsutum]|nr:hypothetical protein ERO13_D09G013866v2 [Gossypium hirsutum]